MKYKPIIDKYELLFDKSTFKNIYYQEISFPIEKYNTIDNKVLHQLHEIIEHFNTSQIYYLYICTFMELSKTHSLKEIIPIMNKLELLLQTYQIMYRASYLIHPLNFQNLTSCTLAYLYDTGYKNFEKISFFDAEGRFLPECIGYEFFHLYGDIDDIPKFKEKIHNNLYLIGINFYKLYWERIYERILHGDFPNENEKVIFNQFFIHCFVCPVLNKEKIENLLESFYEDNFYDERFVFFLRDIHSDYADKYLSLILAKDLTK